MKLEFDLLSIPLNRNPTILNFRYLTNSFLLYCSLGKYSMIHHYINRTSSSQILCLCPGLYFMKSGNVGIKKSSKVSLGPK